MAKAIVLITADPGMDREVAGQMKKIKGVGLPTMLVWLRWPMTRSDQSTGSGKPILCSVWQFNRASRCKFEIRNPKH